MFFIHPYGLVIVLAVLAGYLVAYFRKEKYGLTANDLENLFLLVIPLGVMGARIYHVLDKWQYYSQNLWEIIAVWKGGLGIYGAVGGGLVGIWIFNKVQSLSRAKSRDSKFKVQSLLDFLMPSIALGQAMGRWGNFFNDEVFGPPTGLPWKWFIPEDLRPEMWRNYQFFHPTFLYESLWAIIGFVILIYLEWSSRAPRFHSGQAPSRDLSQIKFGEKDSSTRPAPYGAGLGRNDNGRAGFLTAFYAFWYGLGRFFLEFLRFDTAELWGIRTAQIISLGLIAFGVGQMFRKRKIWQRLA